MTLMFYRSDNSREWLLSDREDKNYFLVLGNNAVIKPNKGKKEQSL